MIYKLLLRKSLNLIFPDNDIHLTDVAQVTCQDGDCLLQRTQKARSFRQVDQAEPAKEKFSQHFDECCNTVRQ